MKSSKKSKSSAVKVSEAWGRIVSMHKRFNFLPHDPDMIDFDDLRRTAAELRSTIKHDDIVQLRTDYLTVRQFLGRIPELPEGIK